MNFPLGTALAGGTSGKEPACQRRGHKRHGFKPWIRKISWRRKWQSTPVFLPGKFHENRSLVGYSPQGHKELDMTEQLHFLSIFLYRFPSPSSLWLLVVHSFWGINPFLPCYQSIKFFTEFPYYPLDACRVCRDIPYFISDVTCGFLILIFVSFVIGLLILLIFLKN